MCPIAIGVDGDSISGDVINDSNANGYSVNGHPANGHPTSGHSVNGYSTNGHNPSNYLANGHVANENNLNGADHVKEVFTPIAICGMACRLPGGIKSPSQLWDFLVAKGDAKTWVPESRYNIDAYLSDTDKAGTIKCPYGYFLDEDLSTLDASFFTMSPKELERCDPQQRQMLEVSREAIEDAGEIDWRGKKIGVFAGSFGEDWFDMLQKDPQQYDAYRVTGYADFNLANRVSYEMDLRGPSMTIRTACSASLVAVNEACLAITRGDCKSAIVGGSSLILAPAATSELGDMGVLSPDGSCKAFSADANGYARGEAIDAIYIKPLSEAIRDGNPVRAVIRGSAVNTNGKTPGITSPSTDAQEALMRHAYKLAGIKDFSETAFIECHGTGTAVGDPIETKAVAKIFGESGIYIGSIKPNLGHAEGASGLNSVLKAVLALENRTIPPNIKFSAPNPNIPWKSAKLRVPLEPTPWPKDRKERVSVNSFGIGGTNAHVILDSAASHNAEPELEDAPDTPQLLVYSANSAESLDHLAKNYDAYLTKHPERLADVAYTLANRREHLPYRSFAVASREQPGTASPSVKAGHSPKIIFVFTGQGAQWPQMGRDLLRNNPVFKASIQHLDTHLKRLGDASPAWTIEAELRRPAKTSRIGTAELSQPLCTAIQIALVDVLRSFGVAADAVVGHSSGEIAGAYASGALTAEEAITAAFHRGAIVKKQTRKGAMAAIGLGWVDVKEFLKANVTVACENSPRSVTLSGDAESVVAVVQEIQSSRPDVLARLLNVDKAYHSYHMAEVGEEYSKLVGPNVLSKAPITPFFSSVFGKLVTEGNPLGPKYWQQNLESPVLFRSAVSNIIHHPNFEKNAIFLEIGPHSALAGPLRQIVAESSTTSAPYIPVMVRGQNSTETLLSAIGNLYTLRAPVGFHSLYPADGHNTLRDLPRYPWNHTGSHWHETRVTREWRYPQHRHHNLLGVKTVESTDLEPAWRNVFHLTNVPWVRDHKVGDDVVLPFAAYISIAGEAIRQVSGVQEGFALRNFLIRTAMVVSEEKPAEIITTLRKRRLTSSLDSQWWEFSITSHNGYAWTKHATGEVTGLAESLGKSRDAAGLSRQLASQKWYEAMRQTGVDYGPHFRGLEHIRTSTKAPGLASALIRNNRQGDEADYHLHPTIVDAALQLLNCGASLGLVRNSKKVLATSIAELSIFRTSSDVLTNISASFVGKGSVVGNGEGVADGQVVLRMTGARLAYVDEPEPADSHASAHHVWKPHIDFLNTADLLKQPSSSRASYAPTLEELFRLSMLHSQRALAGRETNLLHLQKYQTWLESQVQSIDSPDISTWRQLDNNGLRNKIDVLVERLRETPAIHAALALSKVSTALPDIFSGKRQALDVLHEGDTLNKLQAFVDEFDFSTFLGHLTHTKPSLRILQLGAETGSTTELILKQLNSLYSTYTFSDPSSSLFGLAQERFEGVPNMEFATLDIGRDLVEQAFEKGDYDLVIAANVIHRTEDVRGSLRNVRKLLHPEGRLLLQELNPSSKWINYVKGVLPSWWQGVGDGRIEEPYVDIRRWESELRAAGFQVPDAIVTDAEEPAQLNAVIVARPETDKAALKQVSLLAGDNISDLGPIVHELRNRGYSIIRRTIDEAPEPGTDVISFLDKDAPFFADITAENFYRFKAFTERLGGAGLFWLTNLSPIKSKDPRYAQVLGLARALRSELSLDFAVFLSDAGFDDVKILDVFEKFQLREEDKFTPEMEYALHEGQIKVGRLYPFALADLLRTSDADDTLTLSVARSGHQAELYWSNRQLDAPVGDEVEVEVHSAGLNSRDVLIATGAIDPTNRFFGLEAAGVVGRTGPEVQNLQVGDRVIVFGRNTFSLKVTESELLMAKIPENLTFNDAATLAVAYSVAIYSLKNVANLQPGQSALIHSAAGGVDIAAIQIAQMLGAEVYATVGSEDEIHYLRTMFNIPHSRIFHSNNTSFKDHILRETNGRGVDVVLNSLSGDLLHATWQVVADFGKFIEIGNKELVGAGQLDLDVFLRNRSFSYVDLDRVRSERPAIIHQLLSSVANLYRDGSIKPIRPIQVFKASDIQDAFQIVQQNQHTGKIVIELRESAATDNVQSKVRGRKRTPVFNSSASYLLVGGLGGVGRAVSVWLVEHGARHLIFLSRSAGKPEDHDFVRELEAMHATVELVQGSVSEPDDVTRAIQAAGDAPLKGIINLSMLLRDQSWRDMSWDDWHTGIGPKVQGTWNLHNLTMATGVQLDFFILFSSISGIIGNIGQTNYASASSFMDSFVQYRTGLGLAASAVDLGAVFDIGFVSESDILLRQMKAMGYHGVQEKDILDALVVATSKPSPEAASLADAADPSTFALGLASTLPLNNENNRVLWRRDPRFAAYHNASTAGTEASASGGGDTIKAFLSSARADPALLNTPEATDTLARAIGIKVLSLLFKPESELDTSVGLMELGMDSLVSVEMRSWWKQTFGIDISLLEMMGMGTLEVLGKHAAEGLGRAFHGST